MKEIKIWGHIIMFLIIVVSLSGCSSSSENQTSEAQVVWGACPDYINTHGNAECAFVTVPKDYERPYLGTIDLFIWRIKGTIPDDQKKGQVWFIQGGPGDSSVAFATFLPPIAVTHPEWDYYSIDHRGVGNSNCLECPSAAPDSYITAANATACYNEVNAVLDGSLGLFNVTNAAKDLATVIDLTRGAGKVFTYGVSYGTYLVQRFMTLFPDSVDGTIIDSIVPADAKPLDNYDESFNNEGMQIMEQCSQDSTCSEKMSGIASDPWAAAGVVFDKIDKGELCSQFSMVTRERLRHMLSQMASSVYGRALIPATIYRLNRCNASDIVVISHLFGLSAEDLATSEEFRPVDKLDSSVIFTNIAISELYNGISPWAARTIIDAAYVSEDLTPNLADLGYNRLWTAYKDPYIGVRPVDYSKPVLMMNSTVDGNTPLALALGAMQYLDKPNQYFVTVPWAAHGSALSLPPKDRDFKIEESLGLSILFEFMSNPYTAPDTSIFAGGYVLEFSGTSLENKTASKRFFDTEDMWE